MAKKKDELLKNLIDGINGLTEAENGLYDYCQELEVVQNKIRDIEHYLENHIISRNGAIQLMALLQELRIERRQIKQMWEIYNVYGANREKLKAKEWRDFLVTELHKKDKELQTEYKYRELDESYLDELNEDKPLPKGRKPKNISYNNIEKEEELNEE